MSIALSPKFSEWRNISLKLFIRMHSHVKQFHAKELAIFVLFAFRFPCVQRVIPTNVVQMASNIPSNCKYQFANSTRKIIDKQRNTFNLNVLNFIESFFSIKVRNFNKIREKKIPGNEKDRLCTLCMYWILNAIAYCQ